MTISVSAWVDAFVLKTKNGCLLYRDYVPDLERLRKTLRDGGASVKDIRGVIVDVD
jgi:hypothetical protein